MTLAPVFRSDRLFEVLHQEGIVERFGPARDRMAVGMTRIHDDLEGILDAEFLDAAAADAAARIAGDPKAQAEFLQRYFFLILFSSIFEHIGIPPSRLDFYAEMSYCIMGTIAAADNLFDREAKVMLPLKPQRGAVFASVLQLMCFERLAMRACERASRAGIVDGGRCGQVQKRLLSTMATIGRLEGAEEAGTDSILPPEVMIERVHGVRGGLLFSLVTVPPRILENGLAPATLDLVEKAVVDLGTAFQLVDDLTDFEFDLARRSHNILSSEIHHRGAPEEKARLAALTAHPPAADAPALETVFLPSARRALDTASRLTHQSLASLESLGFWFPSRLADVVIQGIVADHGLTRLERIADA